MHRPSRVLFAGVLQPARRLDLVNPADTIPPADTSLGLDFRITAPQGSPLTLKITARGGALLLCFPRLRAGCFREQQSTPTARRRLDTLTKPPNEEAEGTVSEPSASQATNDADPESSGEEDAEEPEQPATPAGPSRSTKGLPSYDVTLDP